MSLILGMLLIYLASALALSGLIKSSLKQDSLRFMFLGAFIIPLLAVYAFCRALLPKSLRGDSDAVAIRAHAEGVRAAEEEIEVKRQELFGHRSQLWVAKRFETRYTMYLHRSVRRVRGLTNHILKETGSV